MAPRSFYTSHYMEEVEQICTRIAIMDKGKNLAIGTTEELKRMIKKSEIISIDILDLLPAQIAAIRDIKHVYEVTFEHHCLKVLCSGGSPQSAAHSELSAGTKCVFRKSLFRTSDLK